MSTEIKKRYDLSAYLGECSMVGLNHSNIMYVVLQYIMEYCTLLVFYVGKRFELDYNNKLYYVCGKLYIHYNYP